jgi:hypothetical protein
MTLIADATAGCSQFARMKGIVTPEGDSPTLRICTVCDGEFLGNKSQTKCAEYRVTWRRKVWAYPSGFCLFLHAL